VHKPAFIDLREGLEVAELLEDSLLGDPVLVDEAADGDHSKAGVLDLGKAVALEGGLILGKAKGVESEITGLTLALEGLEKSNNAEDLDEGDPEDDLGAATLLHEVVVGINGGHLGEEGESVLLLDEEAEDGKHGEAAVLELGLAEHAEVEHVREAKGVEANVAGVLAVEVDGALEEGDSVREVTLHLELAHSGSASLGGSAAEARHRGEGAGRSHSGGEQDGPEHG